MPTGIISWGLVLDFGHESPLTEIKGLQSHSRNMQLTGCHEIVAFIECALYLMSRGMQPSNVNFIVDDEVTAYAGQGHPNRGHAFNSYHDTFFKLADRLIRNKVYTKAVVESTLDYLYRGRFHKVRSHSNTILNLRCDYLARSAYKLKAHSGFELANINTWMASGFVRRHGDKIERWYPPFVKPAPTS